jgi:hypothetical protein
MATWKRRIEHHGSELPIKFTANLNGHVYVEREARTANKNFTSIAVSVLTTSRVARNSGGAARQESSPQSATAYSSVLCAA